MKFFSDLAIIKLDLDPIRIYRMPGLGCGFNEYGSKNAGKNPQSYTNEKRVIRWGKLRQQADFLSVLHYTHFVLLRSFIYALFSNKLFSMVFTILTYCMKLLFSLDTKFSLVDIHFSLHSFRVYVYFFINNVLRLLFKT